MGAALTWWSPPQLRWWRTCLPDEALPGLAPHRATNAVWLASRVGFPTVATRWPRPGWPTHRPVSGAGAADRTIEVPVELINLVGQPTPVWRASGSGSVTIRSRSWLEAWMRALIAPRHLQRPDRLHRPVAGLRAPGCVAVQGSGDRVDGLGLATSAAGLPIGADHLHHCRVLGGQVPGQAGLVTLGAVIASADTPVRRAASKLSCLAGRMQCAGRAPARVRRLQSGSSQPSEPSWIADMPAEGTPCLLRPVLPVEIAGAELALAEFDPGGDAELPQRFGKWVVHVV